MPYRELPPERLADQLSERIAETADDISRIDEEIGCWSALLGDGTDAPVPLLELYEMRRLLDLTLRRLCGLSR